MTNKAMPFERVTQQSWLEKRCRSGNFTCASVWYWTGKQTVRGVHSKWRCQWADPQSPVSPWFPRDAPRLLAEQSAPSEGPCISAPQNLPLPASWSSKIHTVDTIRKLWLYIFEYVPCITGIPSILVGQAWPRPSVSASLAVGMSQLHFVLPSDLCS